MADEFVRKEHFDEHVLRMDERFAHLEDTVKQRFLSLEKRMDLDAAHVEKNFAHVNQRFDDANKHFDQRFDAINQRFDDVNQRIDDLKEVVNALRSDMREDMRQMRNWLFRLYGLVVFGFIGTVVLILFRELIFK
jgi:histidinol dehydrogenase